MPVAIFFLWICKEPIMLEAIEWELNTMLRFKMPWSWDTGFLLQNEGKSDT